LIRLGATPIQSFDDASDIATACKNIYDAKATFILASYPWRFTMKYRQLSRLAEAPTMQWDYQYIMPPDMIQSGFISIYPTSSVSAASVNDYDIIGDVLMSDYSELWAQYQIRPDESIWPSYFTELMINVMMVELSYILISDKNIRSEIYAAAYGYMPGQKTGGVFAEATFIDSRDNPTISISDDTLAYARFAGY
jgi:hypothetical protein